MTSDTQTFNKLRSNFELLRNIIRHSKQTELKVDLSKIETIIHHEIPQMLQHHAPADFHVLFTNFKAEYERFKDFILFDKLIGKNIIALGGGFSSGKSSFLNALMGKNVLPADIDPSTSVPTYIVSGPVHQVQGINVFDTKIEMELSSIRRISHGFGKLENDDDETLTDVVTLGHILNSIFFSTPLHQYSNIAFLDTPGYSKSDDVNHTVKTDEQIARSQLNSSNFILWFVQADAGTITNEDITFIQSLHKDIPKLIIVNKADKKAASELTAIITNIKQVLDLRGIRYVDVLAFSNKEPESHDSDSIRGQLEQWNQQIYESSFARNFKTIFMRCKQYYEDELDQESRRLNQLNKARTIADDQTVIECLDALVADITRNINEIKRINSALKQLQHDFFGEIKLIADIVGIAMPEPSEIELIKDKSGDPLEWLNAYKQKKGIRTNGESLRLLKDIFADIKPVMNKTPGGSQYITELMDVIRTNCVVDQSHIRIHDIMRTSSEYAEMFDSMFSTSSEEEGAGQR
jgi:GTPase